MSISQAFSNKASLFNQASLSPAPVIKAAVRPMAGCLALLTGCVLLAGVATAESSVSAGFDRAYQAALVHDPEVRAAYLQFRAEEQEAPLAFGRLLPNINFSAGYSYEDAQSYFTQNPTGTDDPREDGRIHEHYWSVSLDQPLFNWGAWTGYQATQQAVAAAGLRYSQAEQELILRVTDAYLRLLFAARQEYLYRQQLETIRLQIDQARRQQDLGIGDRITLLEIQAQQDLVRADLLEARSQYEDAMTRLENMTGQRLDVPQAWQEAEQQPLPLDVALEEEEVWISRALNNLAYREAQARVEQARLQRETRRADHYPTVNLNLTYIDRESDDRYRTRESVRLGVDLNLPLYQGGRSQAGLRQADARMQADMARSDHSLAQAAQHIRLNYNRVSNLGQRLEALRQSEASTRNFLEAATRGMELNLRSKIDVLDARNQLLNVQLRYAEALQRYLEADMQLHHAVGELNPDRLRDYDAMFNGRVAVSPPGAR